jgi:hypothetical protein
VGKAALLLLELKAKCDSAMLVPVVSPNGGIVVHSAITEETERFPELFEILFIESLITCRVMGELRTAVEDVVQFVQSPDFPLSGLKCL